MIGIVLGTIAIVLVAIGIGFFIDRKVRLLPRSDELAAPRKPPSSHAAGEAPATAIRASAREIDKLRTGQRCPSCRGAMTAEPDDTVRYNDRELLVLSFTCPACAAHRGLYVELRA